LTSTEISAPKKKRLNRRLRKLQNLKPFSGSSAYIAKRGKEDEIWHPETGKIEQAGYRINGNRTTVSLRLEPNEAVFVIFRQKATSKTSEKHEKDSSDGSFAGRECGDGTRPGRHFTN
jgi:hypothetical protein